MRRLVKGEAEFNKYDLDSMKTGPSVIWLLLPVFDWPTVMIGRGGLLLVVSHHLQSQFLFHGWAK
jgi:hypothetical protein